MNSIRSLRNHLEMFQQTFTNALDEGSPLSPQPLHIKVPLRIHQLTSIEEMRKKEMQLGTGYTIDNNTLFSKFAILGDRVGVGKTFMVLGHISSMSTIPLDIARPQMSNLSPESTSSCFSIHPTPHIENVFDSLVVVPHTIYRQWEQTIQEHTTLKAHFIKSRRDLDKDNIVKSLRESNLTLISSTLLSSFLSSLRGRQIDPLWRRVFYDEADTIKITSTCPRPNANITWYISASYPNLLFLNQYYHSYVIRQLPQIFLDSLNTELRNILQVHIDAHPHVAFFRVQSEGFFRGDLKSQHHLRAHLVVRNSEEFTNKSIQLPTLHREIVRCQTPYTQQLVEHMLPTEVVGMLNAGDIQGALQSLGVSSHTPCTIVEAATEFRQKDLERLRRVLAFKKDLTYCTEQAKENAIDNLQRKIKEAEQAIESTQERIRTAYANASSEACSICFESASDPVITPCCSKLFCGACVLAWMARNPICPLCRTSFHPSALKAIGVERPSRPGKPKKLDALLRIIEENPRGKFLVFSRYENPLVSIQEHISEQFTVGVIQGNKDAVANKVAEFEAGRLNILLLNSRHAAAGLNLPSATHVILLHRMIGDEEKQILGRAYRMGRTEPLHFIQLLHERE